MNLLNEYTGLYTDHYELTMAQGYFMSNRHKVPATFDYFFRKTPFNSGYVIFAGLADLLEMLKDFRYNEESLDYLSSIGFHKDFVAFLKEFRFNGTIHAMKEGEVVFPNESVLRVEGNILETQLVETLVLNILNFESLIATKASRIRQVAGDRIFIDFGLRRAQGLGGVHASKAAVIGGANSTSNVYSAFAFNLTSAGTQAHSWIQSFDDELTAFREFAAAYPENCILLVDTYDTLKSGVPNAIKVAKEMAKKGQKLAGIRLDSGDLAYLSKKARKQLDEAGLQEVKIVASNQLDEFVIKSLLEQKAPIDGFGVGTRLAVGKENAALDGVYKLSMSAGQPRLKISENIEKVILPGVKHVYRYLDDDGKFYADAIGLSGEDTIEQIWHPHQKGKSVSLKNCQQEKLYHKVMADGDVNIKPESPEICRQYARKRLKQLPEEHLRFDNPHYYKVGISRKLMELRDGMIEKINLKMS